MRPSCPDARNRWSEVSGLPPEADGREAHEDLVFTGTRGPVLRGGNYRNRHFSKAVETCQKAPTRIFQTSHPRERLKSHDS